MNCEVGGVMAGSGGGGLTMGWNYSTFPAAIWLPERSFHIALDLSRLSLYALNYEDNNSNR